MVPVHSTSVGRHGHGGAVLHKDKNGMTYPQYDMIGHLAPLTEELLFHRRQRCQKLDLD